MKKIFITGANGFVGRLLASTMALDNTATILRSTRSNTCNDGDISVDFSKAFNIANHLSEVDVIIHCAARVHVMNDNADDPLAAFRAVNTQGTLRLAQQAAESGVKRFIFISSIKVNGESTEIGRPFTPHDNHIPVDPYGLSKYEAEAGLREIAQQSGMEVVIIRPPLVYGPGVQGNFLSMLKWMNKGLPLPLGGIADNKRSLVSLSNLVDLIITCIKHPNAANQTFLVSDDHDLSTTQLLAYIAQALKVSKRLLPIPSSWLKLGAKLVNKPAISERLCGSLQVDISHTKELLNWAPPNSQEASLRETANHFLAHHQKK
ncbi:SDR family oxidoreductase [Psychromonas aquatilis]|uniref:SDR family oxidoreductase n=1 Tax=Psychromonas aquatilis TaxID=2005072 RepID=A0ABU9GSQ2_9GAMM